MRDAARFSSGRRNEAAMRKLSFLNKIRISYGVLIMVPVLILELFVLYASTSFIREQQLIEAKGTIERNHQNIQNQTGVCEKSLVYLTSNAYLKDFLALSDEEYIKRAQSASNIGTLLYNALLSNQFFSEIEVYSDKHIAVVNAIFKNIKAYQGDAGWYEASMEAADTLWWYEDGKYYMTRRIISSVPEKCLGVIRITVKKDLFSNSLSMFSGIPIRMQICEGDEIYFESGGSEGGAAGRNTGNEKDGYETVMDLEGTKWQIHYRVDQSYFSNMGHPQILRSFIVVILLLVSGLFAVNCSTRSLLKYLYEIIDSIKEVREDNFAIRVDETSQDEIGELARSINQMLKKIQVLIDEVYKSKLEKKNLELNLLRSKINPHFLYNNLSAINWIAIENGEDRIYEITTQLAAFYRTALNKGINVDRLAVEMENIKAYIGLQQLAHEEEFRVEYDVDESLLEEKIPIFVMQPLVENAIEHGIDTLKEEKGKLFIQVRKESGSLVIRIRDNGRELYEKIGEGRMKETDYGYGVSNVHNRIRLLCGEGYGVRILADQEGTVSEIRIREGFLVS